MKKRKLISLAFVLVLAFNCVFPLNIFAEETANNESVVNIQPTDEAASDVPQADGSSVSGSEDTMPTETPTIDNVVSDAPQADESSSDGTSGNEDTTIADTQTTTKATDDTTDFVAPKAPFDPELPPIFGSNPSKSEIPTGWVAVEVKHPQSGETLFWTLKPANSPRGLAEENVLINLSTVASGSTGYTLDGNVITLNDSSVRYIIEGSSTARRIKVDTYVTATIVLNGISISTANAPIIIENGSTARIVLVNGKGNTLTCNGAESGIFVPNGTTLIIEQGSGATGSLNVKTAATSSSVGYGAAIGTYGAVSGATVQAGTVIIEDGNITLNASGGGAGIGSGGYAFSSASAGNTTGKGGDVTINGGTVEITTVTGAGIGSGGEQNIGNSAYNTYSGEGGNVTINGGAVTVSSQYGAGIGSGGTDSLSGAGGTVTINGGNVNVYSGNGAGIGGGAGTGGVGGDISINGGTVYAASVNGAGIGCGNSGAIGNATLIVENNADLQAFSQVMGAIMVSNEYNPGTADLVNGFITNVTSTTPAAFTAFNVSNRSDTITFSLPASYHGFAFTGSNTKYTVETTNLSPQQKILVNTSDVDNPNNTSIECDKRIMYSNSGARLEASLTSSIPTGPVTPGADVPMTSVVLSPKSRVLNVGDTLTVTAVIAPSNATDKTLTWVSSNEDTATVDANGKVTIVGKGKGFVTIMATGNGGSCYDFVNIKVNGTGTDGPGNGEILPPSDPTLNEADPGNNLATMATVNDLAGLNSNVAANMFDGDLSTAWKMSVNSFPQEVVIDFGQSMRFDQIKIKENTAAKIGSYKLSFFDGTDWVELDSGSSLNSPGGALQYVFNSSIDLIGTKIKLELLGKRAAAVTGNFGIDEFEIYYVD